MIHLLDASIEPLDHPLLRRMFAARKEVFVDLLRWDVPVIDEHYEIDQFDHEQARYLVVTDGAEAHLASARLLPTTRPHLLATLFPELCEEARPIGKDVFEITRFCLDRSLRASARRRARDTLIVGLVEHAQAHGIRAYCAIAEISWAQQVLAFGWRCRQLGAPQSVDGEMLVAIEIEITADTWARLAMAGIIDTGFAAAVAA
jgi:N-acyl-L-homoserine lactone synthetase